MFAATTASVILIANPTLGPNRRWCSNKMTDSDQPSSPSKTLPRMISVDPDVGFGPHISSAFLECYGEESVFVTAAVDCLNHRFNQVLLKSGKVPADHKVVQYGDVAMREAIEKLLGTLEKQGADNPSVALLRSATGYEEPPFFLIGAASVLGDDLVAKWLERLEQEDYAGAASLLAVH